MENGVTEATEVLVQASSCAIASLEPLRPGGQSACQNSAAQASNLGQPSFEKMWVRLLTLHNRIRPCLPAPRHGVFSRKLPARGFA